MALKSKKLDQVRPTVANVTVLGEDLVRINLNVPHSIRKKWKDIANDRDTTLTDLIIEAMEKYTQVSK